MSEPSQIAGNPATDTPASGGPATGTPGSGGLATGTPASGSPAADDVPVPGARATQSKFRDRTGRDMLLALACLLVPILLVGALLRACGSAEPTVIDPSAAIDQARSAAVFPVLAPQNLADGWRPVQASFRRSEDGAVATLRLGYLTPSDGHLLLVESNEDSATLLERELGEDVRPNGQLTAGGLAWTRSVVRGDEHALVHAESDRLIIIVGRALDAELTDLATSLCC